MFWVALAGPASNILLAVVSAVALGVLFAFNRSSGIGDAFVELLKTFILVNMFLAVFNLIPIHPLDGGKVIEPFLPYQWNRWLETNQTLLSGFLLFFLLLAGGVLAVPVTWAAQELLRVSVIIAQTISGGV
jgi:Zn-dependent protease